MKTLKNLDYVHKTFRRRPGHQKKISRPGKHKKARYEENKLFAEKKRNYFETKLTENIGKPKELWKSLKALRLPNKVSIATINALKVVKVVKYDPKSKKVFQTFFANKAETLIKNLPLSPSKYGIDSVKKFYKALKITTKF